MNKAALEWRYGARLVDAAHASFRIWAPDVQTLAIELDDGAPLPMQRVEGGWFELQTACVAGTRYRYVLPDGQRVPDPASRGQSEDVHDASLVVDAQAYRWRHPDWCGRPWHETVLYEAHVGLFGGFAGLAARLPELAALGITAIELMPIADFPGTRNWGYDGVLPFAPDASYGSPDALRALIDTAHGLGLMVFLDVVYNHFGPDGNYLGRYARGFFRDDIATPWGAALDFRRTEVQDFFTENVLYWFSEFRFDGLRLDAVHAIVDDGWLARLPLAVQSTFGSSRHLHLVVENDANDARLIEAGFSAQWNDDAHHALHVLLTGERDGYYTDYAHDAARHLARCLREGFAYQGEPSTHRDAEMRGTPSAHLSPLSFVAFLQNHDQIGNRAFGERMISLTDPNALRAATTLLLLAPWIPLLFMGEENGETTPFFFFTSYEGELADAVREGRRREFAKFPAFASAEMRERIPDPNQASTFERSRPGKAHQPAEATTRLGEDPDSASFRELTRTLLGHRRSLFPVLAGVTAIDAVAVGRTAVRAHWRLGDGRIMSLYANLGPSGEALPESASWHLEQDHVLFESATGAARELDAGSIAPLSTVCMVEPATTSGLRYRSATTRADIVRGQA